MGRKQEDGETQFEWSETETDSCKTGIVFAFLAFTESGVSFYSSFTGVRRISYLGKGFLCLLVWAGIINLVKAGHFLFI